MRYHRHLSTGGFDVPDRFANGRDLLGIDVGDLDAKFLTQRELQLNHSNWVSTEVFRKVRSHGHTVTRHAKLRDDYFLYSIEDLFLFHGRPTGTLLNSTRNILQHKISSNFLSRKVPQPPYLLITDAAG